MSREEMTKEEAIKILKELPNRILGITLPFDTDFDYTYALNMAIKALEQEPILDKIRAEIEAIIDKHNHNLDDYDFCSGLIRARNIIDKYRKEQE